MSKRGRVQGRGERSGPLPSQDPDAPFVVDDVLGDAVQGGQGPRLLRLERLIFEELDRLFRLEVRRPAGINGRLGIVSQKMWLRENAVPRRMSPMVPALAV